MQADIFFRTFNKIPERQNVQVVTVDVPHDATVRDMVAAAAAACGKALLSRNGRIGVFEIQTDLGIWDREDEGCVLNGAVRFRSWEQLELEES